MERNQALRIVLVGKTGTGKSSLANTIFGEEYDQGQFATGDSSVSVTSRCQSGTKMIDRKIIHLTDTPGFFDTECSSPNETKAEVLKSLKECAPGPHAFLLVFKVDRFTEQENEVVKQMLKCFSEEAFKYTTVVFTHGDQLEKEKRIKAWASFNDDLITLIQKCGGRVHVFDNRYWNNSQDPYRNNQYQVRELLNTIDKTVKKNGGGYYTNSFWQQIKNIKVLDIPLHLLLGLLAGGIALGVAGTLSPAIGVSVVGVLAVGAGSGLVASSAMSSSTFQMDGLGFNRMK